MDLRALAKEIHAEEGPKWWVDLDTGKPKDRNVTEMLALVVSELAEALEGDRKNLMDDKLPHRPMREVELADAVIRLLDIAGAYDFRLLYPDTVVRFYNREPFAAQLFSIMRVITNPFGDLGVLDMTVSKALYTIEELAAFHKMDLEGAILEKMEYNRHRADHKLENRKLQNGKKY